MNDLIARPLSVVVVDDSDFVRTRLCSLLAESPGLRVVAAARDSADALLIVSRFRPDAVVLDIDVRPVAGLEVLRSIKSNIPDCVVVILTNFRPGTFRETGRALGANAIFHKATEFESVVTYLSSLTPRTGDSRVPVPQS